jgi:hypothetical protein
MRALHWLSLGVLAIAIVMGARYFLQRQERAALRAEISALQQENSQLGELRAENSRLLAQKISDTELERLRSDRAALTRLRAEIDKLEETADRKARAMQQRDRAEGGTVLKVALGSNGALLLNGAAADQAALRQVLTGFAARSEPVDIRVQIVAGDTPLSVVKETMEGIAKVAKEVGLRMSLKFETR